MQAAAFQWVNPKAWVMAVTAISEHVILESALNRQTTGNVASPPWQAVTEFVARAKVKTGGVESPEKGGMGVSPVYSSMEEHGRDAQATCFFNPLDNLELEESSPMTTHPTMESIPFPSQQPNLRWSGSDTAEVPDSITEVIELPESLLAGHSVLPAILRSEAAQLIECPVTPPMCPEARLAVTRDRRIVLLAAARQGLGDLRSIARAYHWLVENYKLICMAMPQMAIDPVAKPCLRLFIDHADITAEILQPMLQSATVTVQAYRRLRWGTKTALLLDAA